MVGARAAVGRTAPTPRRRLRPRAERADAGRRHRFASGAPRPVICFHCGPALNSVRARGIPEKVRAFPAALAASCADPARVVRGGASREARRSWRTGVVDMAVPVPRAHRRAGQGRLRERGLALARRDRGHAVEPGVLRHRRQDPDRARRGQGGRDGLRVLRRRASRSRWTRRSSSPETGRSGAFLWRTPVGRSSRRPTRRSDYRDINGKMKIREFPDVTRPDLPPVSQIEPPELPVAQHRPAASKISPPGVGLIDTVDGGTRWVMLYAPTAARTYYAMAVELARHLLRRGARRHQGRRRPPGPRARRRVARGADPADPQAAGRDQLVLALDQRGPQPAGELQRGLRVQPAPRLRQARGTQERRGVLRRPASRTPWS